MHFSIKISMGILAFFIFLNIPVMEINSTPSAKPVYEYDIKDKTSVSSTLDYKSSDFIFHLPVSGSYYSSHQYEIIRLDKKGQNILSFTGPSKQDIHKQKETAGLEGKDGFFTYPPNGSFFLWYPRLGNYTFFYDQSGEFLWSHKSSHYMKAFPSGEYILAMTGDHSRAFFLLPDLSIIGSSEGTLLINYRFSLNTSSDESMKICLSYLDGDVVFYNPKNNNQIRINTGGTTKSIACNFNNLDLAAHLDQPDVSDVIKTFEIDNSKNTPEVVLKSTIHLNAHYNFTIPMGIHDNYLIVLLPTGQNITLFAYDLKGNLLYSKELGVMDTPVDDWRIINLSNSIVAWNSKNIYIMNPEIIFHKNFSIENVTAIRDQLFIQSNQKVISYKMEN